MATIPRGFTLALVSPDGTVLDTIDLVGYDLSKGVARSYVAERIDRIVRNTVAAGGDPTGEPDDPAGVTRQWRIDVRLYSPCKRGWTLNSHATFEHYGTEESVKREAARRYDQTCDSRPASTRVAVRVQREGLLGEFPSVYQRDSVHPNHAIG